MTHETSPRKAQESWQPSQLMTSVADLKHNPAFGFLRLAWLSEMSLPLQDAYDVRLRPNTQLALPDLKECLHCLPPFDLGRFKALEYANSVRRIFSRAFSDEPGLAILAPNSPAYQRGPEDERCDAQGNRHRLICEPGVEYTLAEQYSLELDRLINQLARNRFAGDEEGRKAFEDGWQAAGHELVSSHRAHQEELRARGPVCKL